MQKTKGNESKGNGKCSFISSGLRGGRVGEQDGESKGPGQRRKTYRMHEGLEERATLIHLEPIPMGRGAKRRGISSESPQRTHLTRPHFKENPLGGFTHNLLLATSYLRLAALCYSAPLTVCAAEPRLLSHSELLLGSSPYPSSHHMHSTLQFQQLPPNPTCPLSKIHAPPIHTPQTQVSMVTQANSFLDFPSSERSGTLWLPSP